jgi:hypothetical protein
MDEIEMVSRFCLKSSLKGTYFVFKSLLLFSSTNYPQIVFCLCYVTSTYSFLKTKKVKQKIKKRSMVRSFKIIVSNILLVLLDFWYYLYLRNDTFGAFRLVLLYILEMILHIFTFSFSSLFIFNNCSNFTLCL